MLVLFQKMREGVVVVDGLFPVLCVLRFVLVLADLLMRIADRTFSRSVYDDTY